MGAANKLNVQSLQITVGASAAPMVAINSTPKYARRLLLQAPSTNSTDVLVGNASGQTFPIPKGTSQELGPVNNRMGFSAKYLLQQIYISGTTSDKLNVLLVGTDSDED